MWSAVAERSGDTAFRARTDLQTPLIIRKRRRHSVLPAQSIEFSPVSQCSKITPLLFGKNYGKRNN
jgi:hypothetical protein